MTRLGLILIAIIPWLSDLMLGKSVMASLVGDLLWALAFFVAFLLYKLKDIKLRTPLFYLLFFLIGAWVSLFGSSLYHGFDFSWNPNGLERLTLLHASFLAAGFGLMVFLLILSALWIIKDFSLRQSTPYSWSFKLPALESLSHAVDFSLKFAVVTWGMGLFFAVITAALRWRATNVDPIGHSLKSFEWLLDPQVLGCFFLWFLILSMRFILKALFKEANPFRYKSFSLITILFIVFFILLVTYPAPEGRHGNIPWFTK
jgi:hypothetical protein